MKGKKIRYDTEDIVCISPNERKRRKEKIRR